MRISLSFQKKRTVRIMASTEGKPASFTKTPFWAANPEGVVSISPAIDGLSCEIANIAHGTTKITVTGEAQFSGGTKTLNESFEVECLKAQPDSLALAFDADEEDI